MAGNTRPAVRHSPGRGSAEGVSWGGGAGRMLDETRDREEAQDRFGFAEAAQSA